MIRLSPSLLDSWLYYRDTDFASEDAERSSLADLIRSIKRERREPTEAMLLGRAWHTALERGVPIGADCATPTEEGHEFRFARESVETMRAKTPEGTVRELWGNLALPEIGVSMRLRVDAIHGTTIHDHKATGRINVDKYLGSYQWRCYLIAWGCTRIVYHLARLNRDRKSGVYRVGEYLPLALYGYQDMRDDVLRETQTLLWFMSDRGLTDYRQDREIA